MPLAPGDKLGPYEITALIGKGGMGEVYRATDSRLNRSVAVKVSREQFSERFEREAKVIATLNHPYICTLFDVGPDYLVMEFVDGQPLAGPLAMPEAIETAKKIAEALDHAHRRGVTHRDLKPANILATKTGLKLLDFGLAKIQKSVADSDATLTMGLTQQGAILGTLQYMSPEQVEGQEADARSDIFSFGAVLYELLTGQKAFTGKTSASILASVMKDQPSAPPELAGPLEPILKRCLAKDPDQRFQTAADLKWALENLPTFPTPQLNVAASSPASDGGGKIAWLPWALTTAALIGAAAIAFWPQPVRELHPLRYTIDPPPGFQFTNQYGAGAPSPDGRFIVFAAAPAGASNKNAAAPGQSLWLRPTDSLEARPLPGTENGNFPFWSPDGKSIGFYSNSDRKVKRVEAVGGAPQVLTEAANFEGGTWSQDGVILFSSGNLIQRVAAAGGKPEPVTKPAETRPGSHRDPQFLPDGQAFLFRIAGPDEKANGLYAATLAEPDPPVLLVAGTDRKAAYAPPYEGRPGYLLWLRDQTLVAQRFNPDALKLEGDPVPVAEEVAIQGKGKGAPRRAAFWISQNGLLAYRTGAALGGGALQMTWISRDGKQRAPVGAADDYAGQFRLSPDGKHVALGRTVSDNPDIWLYEFERGVLSRLTFDPAAEGFPVWSPDSRQVAYTSQRSGQTQMFRKNAGGAGQEERLHESQAPEFPMDWSRDGKFLLHTQQDPKTLGDQWVLPMEGTATPRKPVLVLQTPFNEVNSRISPDGKWVAYQSNESGTSQVYIRAMPGGPAGQWQASNAGGVQPRWRGDGKELYYHAGQNAVMAAGVKLLADRVDIETPRELFRYTGLNSAYEPTPDGQRFLTLTFREATGDDDDSGSALKIVSNWQALLK